jgi:hypothetical protein
MRKTAITICRGCHTRLDGQHCPLRTHHSVFSRVEKSSGDTNIRLFLMNKKGLSKLVAIDKQLIESNIMASFNESYYEFQATLSDSVWYCITVDQYHFTSLWGGSVSVDFVFMKKLALKGKKAHNFLSSNKYSYSNIHNQTNNQFQYLYRTAQLYTPPYYCRKS